MKEEQDDLSRSTHRPPPGFGQKPPPEHETSVEPNPGATPQSGAEREHRPEQFNESHFDDLDQFSADTYEEPDRDTDYAIGFHEEDVDEDDAFDDLLPKELESDTNALFEKQEEFLNREAHSTFANVNPGEFATDNPAEEEWESDSLQETESDWDDEKTDGLAWQTAAAATAAQDWSEEEEYVQEEIVHEPWPMSLLLVGAIALLLVIAGVYGVVQQRMETQEQIRQLQASLATTASPQELTESRTALQDTRELNIQLSSQVSGLRLENQRLTGTISDLETQLQALQTAEVAAQPAAVEAAPVSAKPTPAKPTSTTPQPATPQPAAPQPAVAKPAAAKPAATVAASTGSWFVNFGSYGNEAVAQEWATRLRPTAGNVIVAPSVKGGRTFYRVRVVNLQNRAAADKAARQLQETYGLPKLWVGAQ